MTARAEVIIMAGFHDITAAIVGAGFIGPVHVEGLRRLGIRVKGIAGISPEEAERAAATLGLPHAYRQRRGAARRHGGAERAPRVAEPPAPRSRDGRARRGQARRLREAAGDDLGADRGARRRRRRRARRRSPRSTTTCGSTRSRSRRARSCRSGAIGDVLHVHGSYVQDWLLYPTDFNWRVLKSEGGELRAVGDIGTHWLDLVAFVTGLEVEAVMADLMTVHETRLKPPSGSVETFSGKKGRPPVEREPVAIDTEDFGAILLRFKGGARGVLTVSQVTAGRKNCLRYELAGAKKALYFNSEAPNSLWIGERAEANRELMRDPSLLDAEAARFASYPGGHNEGFPDTFKQLYRAVYTDVLDGKRSDTPLYATFEDGHQEVRVCEAIAKSHRERRWVTVGE